MFRLICAYLGDTRSILIRLSPFSMALTPKNKINDNNIDKFPFLFYTPFTSGAVSSAPLINIPDIFYPKPRANFQLALSSDNSIVVVIGNDYNLYLSAENLTDIFPSNFILVDLEISNGSDFLLQDATNDRYLHSYSQVQEDGYARLRTNLATHMPFDSNMVFWSFSEKGYMQFYRDGKWFYDTVGCLDDTTGTVRLWIADGQQGLSTLQAVYGICGLAPLVPINIQTIADS